MPSRRPAFPGVSRRSDGTLSTVGSSAFSIQPGTHTGEDLGHVPHQIVVNLGRIHHNELRVPAPPAPPGHTPIRICRADPDAPPRSGPQTDHTAAQGTCGDARSAQTQPRSRPYRPGSAGSWPTPSPAPPADPDQLSDPLKTPAHTPQCDHTHQPCQWAHRRGSVGPLAAPLPATARLETSDTHSPAHTVALNPRREIHTPVPTAHHRQLTTTQTATADHPLPR